MTVPRCSSQRLDILETLSAAATELAAQKDNTSAAGSKRALITDLSEGGPKQELRPLYAGGDSGPVRSVRGVPELRLGMGTVRFVEFDHDEEEAGEAGENRLAVGVFLRCFLKLLSPVFSFCRRLVGAHLHCLELLSLVFSFCRLL